VLEYPKGVEGLARGLSHNSPQLVNSVRHTLPIERPAMADDVVDYYGGTSDSDSERDKVDPLQAPTAAALAGSCIMAQALHFSQAVCRASHWH
jgi:hypothetical protein